MNYPNIKAEMKYHNTTIKNLALQLNLSTNSVSFKLNGKREFTLSEIEKIANIFNCSLDYLVGHEVRNISSLQSNNTSLKIAVPKRYKLIAE